MWGKFLMYQIRLRIVSSLLRTASASSPKEFQSYPTKKIEHKESVHGKNVLQRKCERKKCCNVHKVLIALHCLIIQFIYCRENFNEKSFCWFEEATWWLMYCRYNVTTMKFEEAPPAECSLVVSRRAL